MIVLLFMLLKKQETEGKIVLYIQTAPLDRATQKKEREKEKQEREKR